MTEINRVDQRTSYDCLRACLATITGLPYEQAPDISGDWEMKASKFLQRSPKSGLVVAIGESPRGCKGGHAVVCNPNGELVHDPHASREGVVKIWQIWGENGTLS